MSEELWYVKLANGDVHRVTLDQLDGAFQAGHVDESTLVLATGATQWIKLGELAGLDDEAPEPIPEQASQAPAAGYVAPVPLPHYAAPVRQAQTVAPAPFPQYAQYAAPVHQAQTIAPAPLPQYAAPVSQRIAAGSPSIAPPSYAAPVHATGYAAPRGVAAASIAPSPVGTVNSLRPMSTDVGDLDLDVPFRRRSRKGWAVAVLGLVAIAGGVSLTANRGHLKLGGLGDLLGQKTDLSAAAAAAAAAVPPPAADPVIALPPAAAPAPPPAPVTAEAAPSSPPVAGSSLNPDFTNRLNEDTKHKLLATDKTHEQKAKARHVSGGSPSSGSRSKSTTFTTGGNKYDPLNSSI